MQRLIGRLSSLLAVFFVAGFSVAAHAVVMPLSGHSMGAKNHTSGDSTINCATLCSGNTLLKDALVLAIREDEDEEPIVPFYVSLRSSFIPRLDSKIKFYSIVVKPPPKVPIYIFYGVFRV